MKPSRISPPPLTLIALTLLLCSGCAETAISTKPFDQFSSDVQQLSKSADQVCASGVAFNQAGYLAQLQEKPKFHMTDLLLQRSGNDFITPDPEPTFIEVRGAETCCLTPMDFGRTTQQLCSNWQLLTS